MRKINEENERVKRRYLQYLKTARRKRTLAATRSKVCYAGQSCLMLLQHDFSRAYGLPLCCVIDFVAARRKIPEAGICDGSIEDDRNHSGYLRHRR